MTGREIGRDGLAMLVLSVVLAVASLGSTLLAVLAYVVWIGAVTATTAPRGSIIPGSIIIVLGLRLRPDGEPEARYRLRLERARRLLVRAPGAEIVVLGGRTRAGAVSEAEAGSRYLQRLGVPPEKIRLEDQSRHTLENLRHYREHFAIPAREPPVLVTNRFHLARSVLLARGMGVAHTPCAAEDRAAVLLGEMPRMVMEAVLIHWYLVGRTYGRLARNDRMIARIT